MRGTRIFSLDDAVGREADPSIRSMIILLAFVELPVFVSRQRQAI
jgi:hypothetical protein